jgi:hypothetical protein
MTFEAGGKQYVAIMSGLSQISKGRLILTPELGEMRNQTMLFVFSLSGVLLRQSRFRSRNDGRTILSASSGRTQHEAPKIRIGGAA